MTLFWLVRQALVPMHFRNKPFALLRLNGRTGTGGATLGPAGALAPPSFQKCSESTVHNADYLPN
jgi:hypothetical protein